jgi:hypothetical protein
MCRPTIILSPRKQVQRVGPVFFYLGIRRVYKDTSKEDGGRQPEYQHKEKDLGKAQSKGVAQQTAYQNGGQGGQPKIETACIQRVLQEGQAKGMPD